MMVAAHSVVEMYSVLTRIPRWRMSPRDASTLIRSNLDGVPDVQLPLGEVWKALEEAAQFGIRGGRIHDALIARCAIRGRASTLLTWNLRDFTPFAGEIRLLRPVP